MTPYGILKKSAVSHKPVRAELPFPVSKPHPYSPDQGPRQHPASVNHMTMTDKLGRHIQIDDTITTSSAALRNVEGLLLGKVQSIVNHRGTQVARVALVVDVVVETNDLLLIENTSKPSQQTPSPAAEPA